MRKEDLQERKEQGEGLVKEYNYCIRCGRRLKTQENRIRGMGKICYERGYEKNSNERYVNAIRKIIEHR